MIEKRNPLILILLVILAFRCVSLPSLVAQNKSGESLKRYADPDAIDPLNINFDEYYAEDLSPLRFAADMAYEKKEYLKAAKIYLYIVNRNTDDADSYYKIAGCYSQLGMAEYAINFLILAVNAGYYDFSKIKSDETFSILRKNPETDATFEELIKYGDKFGQTRYYKVTKLEKCLLFLPDDYDPDKQYPLIIGLHGNGSNAYLFSDLWKYIKDEGVIFAVPQSPYNYATQGGRYTQQCSWSIISNNKNLWEVADPLMIEYFLDITRGISAEYNISKKILFGFSQGVAFAYAAGIKYHDVFDGLICFGGRLPDPGEYPWFLSAADLKSNNDLKIFIAHGTKDPAINPSEARKSNRILKENGYKTRLEIFEGGHYVLGDVLREGLRWIN